MRSDTLKSVLQSLNEIKGHARSFECIPIAKHSFGKLVFVDGGSQELIATPSFTLSFIRIAAVTYHNNKRIDVKTAEYYLCQNKLYHENGINLGSDSLDTTDATRRLLELKMAQYMSHKRGVDDAVVIDGSFDTTSEIEATQLRELLEARCIVSGLSKTTTNSAVGSLNQVSGGPWIYENFVKLHEKSQYVFRLDTNKTSPGLLFSLSQNAADPIFLGYPYGLIDVDQKARVSNQEKEYLLMRFMIKAGSHERVIRAHLNSANAHSILDSIH